ncbi:uncharacterized protein Z520_03862 [Fonsecaea multimorphosa CBS 102226]|uniref:Glycoside hydrolase family 5 domain-containing protein n=1 Tax=Fonsecaea multimorphosa CBS 102226 TaxID=1442371 RepID=A0A0D2IT93_9EURO|nr:uncharacterized protein Z520_03862 [Fonsecaea multimorphosa CBS 102226]KIY00177.1 hypothetical protein Z520_03862 [Fonsecaea multimorphosa CBS 102226]OAL27373.1 hypothetical protein AYO22_03648 [Fonsecaea multimorphosa]
MRKALRKAFEGITARDSVSVDAKNDEIERERESESETSKPGFDNVHPSKYYRQTTPPTPKDILRYRYQHGTNLGGIFVLERWMFGSMFDQSCSGDSELDAVIASITAHGLDATRQKWEAHWANALTDSDLDWLVDSAHCNAIRLPIGYFTLGPAFCANTAFAMEPSQVYVNAWSGVKRLVWRCFQRGIGVLIDLHGVPGGANRETHSGTSSGKAELWANPSNLDLATRCLIFIAEEVSRDPQLTGVIGLQVCNEAIFDPPGMYEWYNDVIQQISRLDSSLPIYISDGWDLGRAVRFTRAYNNPETRSCPVIVDTHKYWTFDAKDTSRSPYEIIQEVKTQELHELDSTLVGDVFSHQAAVAVFVGEYSLALAPQTWSKAPEDQKPELMRQFGQAQSHKWQSRASGAAFWTFKMDWMPGWEWGFRASVDAGQVVCSRGSAMTVAAMKSRLARADENKSSLSSNATRTHTEYWKTTAPGAKFEHRLYTQGWELGWADARDFFAARLHGYIPWGDGTTMAPDHESPPPPPPPLLDENQVITADTIGALDLWILKRMREARVSHPKSCPMGWEFEHGFRKGVSDFEGHCVRAEAERQTAV